jgi:polysaccharide biosynthesis protein PslA
MYWMTQQVRLQARGGNPMKADLAMVPAHHEAKVADDVMQRPADTLATSLERRSPTRQASRGDKGRVSPAVFVHMVRASDLLLLLFSGLLAKSILTPLHWLRCDGALFLATFIGTVVTTAFFSRSETYQLRSLCSLGKSLPLLPLPLLVGGGSMIVCLFMLSDGGPAFREWPFLWLALSALLLTVSRCYLSRLLRGWTESGKLARRVAVIGAGEFSREFIERLRAEPNAYTVVGLYDDRRSRIPGVQEGVRVRGTVRDLLARSREEQIDLIVIALPLRAVARISKILEQIGSAVADICLTIDFAGFRYESSQISSIGSNPVVLINERPLKDWQAGKKLAFDLVIGSMLLIILAPFLALIALAIRLDSPGPVLFRQPRLGFNNRLFTCYKFRTMHHGMTDLLGDRQVTRGDPRVTRLGRWLRALSLDELPQLLNVFKGDMSLVGPRPHPPNTKAADKLFTDVVANYAFRHRVKPGITGWAQVNGWRGETKTVEQIENRVACDLAYIDNWSVWFDLKIMVLTVTREILSRHAF